MEKREYKFINMVYLMNSDKKNRYPIAKMSYNLDYDNIRMEFYIEDDVIITNNSIEIRKKKEGEPSTKRTTINFFSETAINILYHVKNKAFYNKEERLNNIILVERLPPGFDFKPNLCHIRVENEETIRLLVKVNDKYEIDFLLTHSDYYSFLKTFEFLSNGNSWLATALKFNNKN
jgi:hypothetical protein